MMSVMVRALLLVLLASAAWQAPPVAADQSGASQPAPAGIAVDGDGNVYVSDYALDRLVKFGSDGSVVAQWGGSGSALGQFNAPFGVALDEHNTLFVVDQLNNRVQRFAADGTVLGAWGTAGAGASEMRTPFGVAAGGARIFVADFGNDRVQVYSQDGSLLASLGGHGSGDGQFLRPAGVAVDHEGTLYVTDHFNDRIQRFGGDGHFQAQLGAAETPGVQAASATATAAGTGGLAVATPAPSPTAIPAAIGTPAAAPAVPTVFAPPGTGSGTMPDAQLRRPEGLALDHEGNLWVADYGRDRVVKLAPDGRFMLALGSRGSGPGEFVGPKGVAIDPSSGRLYVADTGNARVQRLAPDGTPEAAWPLP